MRTPNCKCCICQKPMYRRPNELERYRHVACIEHRAEAQRKEGQTKKQIAALKLGRTKGKNHLVGVPKSEESKRKRAKAMKLWCANNPDKIKTRSEKTRGSNHYNWKGGTSSLNAAIRRMTEYRNWSRDVRERDGKCVRCDSTMNLDSHHTIPFAELLDEYNITSVENARHCAQLWHIDIGETLCGKCHAKEHGKEYVEPLNGRRHQPKKQRRSFAGKNNPNWRGGKVQLICAWCNGIFYAKPAKVKHRVNCSKKCKDESQRRTLQANAA